MHFVVPNCNSMHTFDKKECYSDEHGFRNTQVTNDTIFYIVQESSHSTIHKELEAKDIKLFKGKSNTKQYFKNILIEFKGSCQYFFLSHKTQLG